MKLKLRAKLLIPMISITALTLGASGILSYVNSREAMKSMARDKVESVVVLSSNMISSWIEGRRAELAQWSMTPVFVDAIQGAGDAKARAGNELSGIKGRCPHYLALFLVNAKGELLAGSSGAAPGQALSEAGECLKACLIGEGSISRAMLYGPDKEPVFITAAPVAGNEGSGGALLGVLSLERMRKAMLGKVDFGKTGYTYLYNKKGLAVAHPDRVHVLKNDLKKYDFGRKILEAGQGVLTYSFRGLKKIAAFTPIKGTPWNMIATLGYDELMAPVSRMGVYSLVVFGIALALAVLITVIISNALVKPLRKALDLARAIALGDLSQRLDMTDSDEIGDLARALDSMCGQLQQRALLAATISEGDLTSKVDLASDKDMLGIALRDMSANLGQLVGQAGAASKQVRAGAVEISSTSQALSQGAVEQASALEEINASLSEVDSQVRGTSDNIAKATEIAKSAAGAAEGGNSRMRDLSRALKEIHESGGEIAGIARLMEDIAFQTNLLALNASVEAARAGSHGRGFAVVAEEVRNLAAKSGQAASETRDLIEKSLKRAELGSDLGGKASQSLRDISESITEVTELMSHIEAASRQQAGAVSEVTQGLNQVDSVTQHNTASAEETAAAAEELSDQAHRMEKLLAGFTLVQGKELEPLGSNEVPAHIIDSGSDKIGEAEIWS